MKAYPYILLLILSITHAVVLRGQTTKEEIFATLEKTGGVLYTYPEQNIIPHTPAPEGYEPFYISHLGRHGSRYLTNEKDYQWAFELFEEAYANRALTPLGIEVYQRLGEVWAEAEGMAGSLSPLGVRQQKGIAFRMYKSFRELFSDSLSIMACSTIVPRCVLSMTAFCEQLKELNPTLQITKEAAEKNMRYLDYYTDETRAFKSGDSWREQYHQFEQKHVNPDRLISTLFSDAEFMLKKSNPVALMWALFTIAGNIQNMETNRSFYDLFDEQELFDLWQCGNYHHYVNSANCALNKRVNFANAKPLLKNILETAQTHIACGEKGITLRFAHDGNLIPLTLLLHLSGCYESISEPAEFYKVWSNFKVSPMAANIQLVFFQKKDSDDILVKFLHNEKETLIPPVTSDMLPYYHWKDINRFYNSLLNL